MNKKIAFMIAGLLLLFSLSFYIYSSSLIRNSPAIKPECNSLYFSSPEAINLLFFSDRETAKSYADYFLSSTPYSKHKESFNFYYLDSQPDCKLYKNIALYCYSRNLIKSASACPNDFIVAIESENEKIRSSAFMNVLSINENHPKSVLLHEFGHVFANLAEEYTPANLLTNSQNCVSKCEDFNNLNEGCFSGCSKQNLFRSIDSGVMRTLKTSEYGNFNENLIINKINKNKKTTLTGFVTSEEICNSKYYLYDAEIKTDSIALSNPSIETGCIPADFQEENTFSLYEENQKVLDGSFNEPYIFTDSEGETQIEGEIYTENAFSLAIPYIENADSLEIIVSPDQSTIIDTPQGELACPI